MRGQTGHKKLATVGEEGEESLVPNASSRETIKEEILQLPPHRNSKYSLPFLQRSHLYEPSCAFYRNAQMMMLRLEMPRQVQEYLPVIAKDYELEDDRTLIPERTK